MSTMNTYDTIDADQIEDGDQILWGDDPLENVRVLDDQDEIIIEGYSHLTGDVVVINMHHNDRVELWAI